MFTAELARLKTEYVRLPEKDQTFALSLLQQQARTGALSARQWPWVKKLVDRLDQPQDAAGPRNLGDQTELRAMFATAGEKIKFPHLLLRHDARRLCRDAQGLDRRRAVDAARLVFRHDHGRRPRVARPHHAGRHLDAWAQPHAPRNMTASPTFSPS